MLSTAQTKVVSEQALAWSGLPILEGDYVDRRMTHFTDMQDIKAKKAEFERVLKQLVKLNERPYEKRFHAPGIH